MAGARGSSEAFGSPKRNGRKLSGVEGTTNDDWAVTKRRQRLVRSRTDRDMRFQGTVTTVSAALVSLEACFSGERTWRTEAESAEASSDRSRSRLLRPPEAFASGE